MAARRLLIVMLVLLGISTLAATLAPQRPGDESSTTTTSAQPEEKGRSGGRLRQATLRTDAKRAEVVDLRRGDQLALTVKSPRTVQVKVSGLGLLDDAAHLSPARFDIFAERRGRYEVRTLDPDRRLAVLDVRGARP